MPDNEKLAIYFSSEAAGSMAEEAGGRFRTVSEILDALADEDRRKTVEDLAMAVDDRIRWLKAIHAQCEQEQNSISEALRLRDSVALFLRKFPIPHKPGAGLAEIVIPALTRERKACSGPLLKRLFRAVWIALKGDIE